MKTRVLHAVLFAARQPDVKFDPNQENYDWSGLAYMWLFVSPSLFFCFLLFSFGKPPVTSMSQVNGQ
jgi:hypothetical protein